MTQSTQLLVCGGISVVFLSCLFWRVSQDWKDRFQRPEDGHDRVERRELEWYWNSDQNRNVEKIPFESPLNEGLSRRSAQP
jgi:hypothetical protein